MPCSEESPFNGAFAEARPFRRELVAFALVELLVSLTLLALVATSSTLAFLHANRQAAVMRAMTAARGIVQRNIDTALTVGWTSTLEPAILTLTLPTGTLYDDDAPPESTADNLVQIAVMENGTTKSIPGNLWRIVTDVTPSAIPPDDAQLRSVTFRLDYTYLSRPYSVQMDTERAIDD